MRVVQAILWATLIVWVAVWAAQFMRYVAGMA